MKRNRNDRASRRQVTCPRALRARRFFRPLLEQFEDRRLLAAVLTVNSALDTDVRDSVLTFRESILVSNRTLPVATLTAAEQAQVSGTPTNVDADTIAFNIPGSGVRSISTATALPALTDPVIIDGYTQPGASANTLAVGSDAVLLIEVFSTTNQTGLVLSGGGSTVRGLVLNRFFDAVSVVSSNNVIEGNFIGIAADGATDRDNQFNGIRVTAGANNLIGGITPAARNVLGGRGFFSGNYSAQIAIGKASSTAPPVVNTTIRGNYIGINAAGTAPISTASFVKVGVSVGDGVNTIIGGTDADDGTLDGVVHARNVISGNGNGIYAAVFNNGVNSGYLMDGLTIQGNFVGVNATGTGSIANQGFGVFAGEAARSTNLLLGGTAPGAGNVISGNRSSGFIGGALHAAIEGNRVGTDLSGTLDLGNGIDGSAGQGSGGEGIHVSLGGNEGPNFQITIGGTTPAARNIISGNAANGILATGIQSGSVTVQGNYIGTQADGQTPLANQFSGISMNRSVAIGGTVAGTGNVIAFNRGSGVSAPIGSSGVFTVPILGNSIHSNSNLGIDLNTNGASGNDLGDADTGINNSGQNFPVLTGINAVGGNTVISGRLNSNASSNYRIEFFYNDARDPSGYGEGQTYLGFTDVTTDSSGNVSFVSPVVPGLIPAGRFVTATATKTSTSETSEFSFSLASLIVTNTLDSGIGSLREAITMANTFVNFDRDGVAGNDVDPITFAIPAAGVQTITPLSALPTIAEAVSIDGYTQPGASPNTLTVGSNAQLLIELNGGSAGSSANGLTLAGVGNSTVRGLVVNRFGASGVVFESSNNVVEGSYFGIDAGGTIERSNLFAGVRVNQGTNNRIGGTTTQARNVLAGNGSTTGTAQIVVGFGVGTVIRGNYIGVNAAGTAAVHPTASGNDDGIYVNRGVATIIGGNDADDGLADGLVRAGNVISGNLMGIRINATGSDPNSVNGITIQGNTIGLDATGTVDVGNFADGISAVAAAFTSASSVVQIGGTQAGAGNIIAANDGRGFAGSAANLVLEGNRIGTDISGTLNFGNGSQGVHVLLFGELGLNYQIRVGGTTPAARNIISGNAANGVLVTGETSFGTPVIAIQGNYIGTQADGMSPLPNVLNGVELQRNGSIGGTAAGAGNVIAFNRQRGVNLISGPTMPVLSNSIFSNGAAGNTLSHLGIDLSGNGVTLNDPNDGDFGVNRLQNFPVFSSAMLAAGTVTLHYAVPSSTSNANYPLRIEFFKADVDGQEGQTFLGFDTYTAAEAGTVKTFVLTPAVTLAANDKLVATATDNLGNTSEFSVSQTVTTANQPPVANAGPDVTINNFLAFARVGSFTDPDANTWTATVNYGDGSGTQSLALNPDKTFSLSHSYLVEGNYTTTVTVNDGNGGIGTDTLFVTVNRFTVDTTADNTLTDGLLTLREAIANANVNADLNTIRFNVVGSGVQTITPTSTLPTITQPAVVDGYTQPGASANTLVVGSNAVLLIEIAGGSGPGNGLIIGADGTTVRGLVMNRFGSAIMVQSGGNTIEGNWLGIAADGNTRLANVYDVFMNNSVASANNLIGGTTPGSRNVMAGTINDNAGIMLFAGGSATIQGNYIGMNAQGTDGIGASGRIYLGTPGNLIGGTAPGAGNLISGRAMEVYSSGNTVQGNTFGLNASGTGTLANNLNGIFIRSHSSPTDNNLIGGTTPEARNVFATNGTAIDIANSTGPNVGNRIQGNYFGTNKAGTSPAGLPSVSGTAIRISGGMNNLVGGTAAGAGNVIANFANGSGIEVLGSNNTIQGNRIGTNAAGTAAIPNGTGIYVGNYVSNNLIGGSSPGAGNVISGNYNDGMLFGPAGTFNTIQGNLIGVAADGISPLGNGAAGGNAALRNGIRVEGSDNLIGGTGPGEGNTIAFNFGSGVLLPFTNVVAGSGFRNSVVGNAMFSNGALGIDIFGGGVNTNDLNDTDSGPNDVQNFPVINSAVTGGVTTIAGTLNSTANGTFRVEFFASTAADPSGFGEGQTYLGFATVTTDGSGNGSFSFSPAAPVPVGQFITSTATSAAGNTSEFSAIRVVAFVPVNQPPAITSNGGGDTASVSVPENTTAVTTVTATDPDAGTTLTYSISGGADAARFTINPSSGALTFVAAPNFETPTDADANNSYLVVVQASDGSLIDSQTLTVTVTNANESPVITSNGGGDTASVSVPENTLAVTTVTASDPDVETTIVYSISGGADAAKFAINPSNGALTFSVAPNFESPTDTGADNTYDLVVTASDGSLSDSQTLTVTVSNVNETPMVTSNGGGDSASVNVSENTTAVTTVTALDPDAVTTLTYSISGGADAAQFAINPSSGAFTFITAPSFGAPTDADANNSYLVNVQASDGSLTDSQSLTVTVTNINEPPVITSNGGGNSASVSVPENTSAVTTVAATDADAGTTLTYSISGGADAAKFAINPTSGVLTFVVAPDYEAPADADANNSYLVIVQASDGSLIDSQALTVTVTNANETPAITSNGGGDSASVSVPENTTAVTTVAATDPDAGTTLTYSISGGADAAKFAINPSSGALTFLAPPNFESPTDAGANNVYDVVVAASDGSALDTQILAVNVVNANEPPVVTSNGGGDSASVNVPENTTGVTSVTATDPDAGTTLTYSISGGADAAKFAINPSSGALAFVAAPNFEAPTDADANNTYLVTVQASDGSLSDLQALTVTVTNANESPVITSNGGGDSANLSVPENTTAVTTVAATDPDAGATLTYSISGGADAAKFTINATTGVLTFATAPNFESPTDVGGNNVYDLIVQASDGSLIDTQAISVTVTDVAEAAYSISGKVFKDVTGNGKSADDLPWSTSTPVTLNLYRDVNGDGVFQSGDTLVTSTATGSGGVYTFVAPAAGKYLIKEVVPSDYVRTFPVLSDYAAVNLTGAASSGNDWYNAEKCDLCVVTNVSYVINHGGVLTTVTDLRGNTHEGDIVTANFTVTATHQVTLVTYNAPGPAWDPVTASQQTVFDFHTATFTPGSHSLTVDIPKNFYQVDLVCGAYINQLGPAGSNIFYTAQNRLISADNGGVNALNAPAIDLELSTSVNNANPLLGSNVVITVMASNAAGWSAATGVRVKDALPSGLTFVSATATQGTYNSSTGEWNLVNPLNSGATATLTITATVSTAGEKKNAAQVTAAGAPDIDSTPNNDSSPSTPQNEDDDDSVSIVPQLWTKYFVVNDSSTGSTREKTFEYASDGTGVENYQLSSGNTAPRGAATTAAGNKVWVIDANKKVYVYDAAGALLGSWSASGLTSSATPEGIATNGTDIWIVDAQQDKVFKYANAASRTSGSQSAASSFALNSGNKSPKDIVASSTNLWVVDDSSTDKVFKYTLAGACVGSWTIAGGGGSPTGITLDPANVNHLWIVDKSTDRVYQFNAAASRTSGSQSAASSFPLGNGNTGPEGIADPPPDSKQVEANTSARSSAQISSARAFDVALLAVTDELNGLSGGGRKKRQ